MTSDLPNTTLSRECLVMEKGSNGGMYLATDIGAIFYTNNSLHAMRPKQYPGSNLATTALHLSTNGLEINYKVNKMRAAPYSRGVWEADFVIARQRPIFVPIAMLPTVFFGRAPMFP